MFCIAGCSLAPDLPDDERIGTGMARQLSWPSLLPAKDLPRSSGDVVIRTEVAQEESDTLRARADALRARAAGMTKPILTPQDRASLGATNG